MNSTQKEFSPNRAASRKQIPISKTIHALFGILTIGLSLLASTPTGQAQNIVTTYFSTANAAMWAISGGGATKVTPVEYPAQGGISIKTGPDTYVTGVTDFTGFWLADYVFYLPYGATHISLAYSNVYVDDRGLLLLNGTPIAASGTGGLPQYGSIVLTEGGAPQGWLFLGTSGAVSGVVTNGFSVGGYNTLRVIVNNTGTGVVGSDTPLGETYLVLSGAISYESPTNAIYDISRDFSLASNPNWVWSYGWKSTLTGAFTLLPLARTYPDAGGLAEDWVLANNQIPIVYHNTSTPGTVTLVAGFDGWPQNFCVIRFTVPNQGGGTYGLESAVRCYDAFDADYHVVVNGVEVFSQFLAPNSATGYTNTFTLAAGDTVDFMSGHGADGREYGSGLKIQATLSLLTSLPPVAPVILTQSQSQTVMAGTNVLLSVTATGTPPPSYQWKFNGTNVEWATAASLLLTNVQLEDSGEYTVAVTNSAGHVISDPAILTVLAAPWITAQPTGLVGYWGKSVSFQVRAKGTKPLRYLWYVDGFSISWATNASLVLTNLEMSAGGDYWVEVCNSLDCVTSASAQLVVNPAGISLGLYPGVTVDGVVGKTYGIQYTTNVTVTSLWTTLTNFTLTQPVHLWIDTEADTTSGNHPKRFYRVIPIP